MPQRLKSNLVVKSGQPMSLDQFNSSEHPGGVNFFIIRATARAAK